MSQLINGAWLLKQQVEQLYGRSTWHAMRVDNGQMCIVHIFGERLPDLKTASQLKHPHLVETVSSGQIFGGDFDGQVYVAQEAYQPAVPEPQARLEAACSVAQALQWLDEQGISHLHLTAPRIVRTKYAWKLADTALIPTHPDGLLALLDVLGEFDAAAPEVLEGQPSPAADVWSLGRILKGWSSAPPFDLAAAGCLHPQPDRRFTATQLLDILEGRPASPRASMRFSWKRSAAMDRPQALPHHMRL